MAKSQKPLVTITGLTGYVGSHITHLFLQDGGYRVRGCVADIHNEEELQPLKDAFSVKFDQIELAEIDLRCERNVQQAI